MRTPSMAVLAKPSVAKYGLTLHPEKTKLIGLPGKRPVTTWKPGSFDMLALHDFWGKSGMLVGWCAEDVRQSLRARASARRRWMS